MDRDRGDGAVHAGCDDLDPVVVVCVALGAIQRLEKSFSRSLKEPTPEGFKKFREFNDREGMIDWECFFVPEENFYLEALDKVSEDDVIFDVGAGDLRFDLLLSPIVKKVYAVEINPEILGKALKIIGFDIPKNLIAIRGNAFEFDLPRDVTKVICLMIHRKHDFPESWKDRTIMYGTHQGLKVEAPT